MDVLSKIIATKRVSVADARRSVTLEQMVARAHAARRAARHHALSEALRSDGINIIAEFKRRSPSKGMIRADADLVQVVRGYQSGGAAAVSVLTETDNFAGSLADLREVKATIDLPVLRKDFIFEEYQVYESAVAGADALLLIVATLDDEVLLQLRRLTEDKLGMDALVEVHTTEEMKRAAACGATLVGVNNRDLRTFEVSLQTSLDLAPAAPRDVLLVSESGLHSSADLRRLREAGYQGFLIGETLMRADSPEQMLHDLRVQK